MATKQTKWKVAALTTASALGLWWAGSALFGADEAKGTEHLTNQVWIDHMPRDNRDMVLHMVVLDHRDGQFGAIGKSSTWRHMVDVYKWKLSGDELQVFFPQDRVRGAVRVRTWNCEGEAPAPFELCLELTGRGGETMTLYSREDWEVRPHRMEKSIENIVDDYPTLGGVFEPISDEQADVLGELDLDDAHADRWRVRSVF